MNWGMEVVLQSTLEKQSKGFNIRGYTGIKNKRNREYGLH